MLQLHYSVFSANTAGPAPSKASLFGLVGITTCAFQLASFGWFPQLPQFACVTLMPPLRRRECCGNRTPSNTNPSHSYRVWFLPYPFITDASTSDSLSFIFIDTHLAQIKSGLHSSLTTQAFDKRRMSQFEPYIRMPSSAGLPPSNQDLDLHTSFSIPSFRTK